MKTETQYAPYKDIRPDPDQPRREFPDAELIELSENILAVGIKEELLVRPDPQKKTKYMLVDGERRWRAAGLVKIETVPIRVREMTDAEARSYQRVSGTQRANLTLLEQADDFARELGVRQAKDAKFSVDLLAKELGYKRSNAYNFRAVAAASKPVRAAMLAGKIDFSKALLICGVAPGLQQKVLKDATTSYYGDEPPSCRALAETIKEEYQRPLRGAPFDPKDAKLCPKAGACVTCPKRTGNMNQAEGGNPDVCTDTDCFTNKTEIAKAIKLQVAKDQGATVIEGDSRIFGYSSPYKVHSEFYTTLDTACDIDPKKRTYRKLLGEAAPKGYAALDPDDKVWMLQKKSELQEALVKGGHKFAQAKKAAKQKVRAMDRGKQEANERRVQVMKQLLAPALEKLGAFAKQQDKQPLLLGWLVEILAEQYFYSLSDVEIAKIKKMDLGQAWKTVVGLAFKGGNFTAESYGEYPKEFRDLCKLAGVNYEAEEKKLLAPKATPAATAAKKKGAKK